MSEALHRQPLSFVPGERRLDIPDDVFDCPAVADGGSANSRVAGREGLETGVMH